LTGNKEAPRRVWRRGGGEATRNERGSKPDEEVSTRRPVKYIGSGQKATNKESLEIFYAKRRQN